MSLATGPGAPAAAILLAAGSGSRFGGGMPKQFQEIEGRAVCMLSLELFDALDWVGERVIVSPPDGLPMPVRRAMQHLKNHWKTVMGGHRRQDSVAHGLSALEKPCSVALVHDTARPFPDPAAIRELARRAAECGGGLIAAHCTDTVKLDDGAGRVERTLDRSRVWLAQTPQAIRGDMITKAAVRLREPEREYTDEAALLEAMGVPVALVAGAPSNFKITFPEDLERVRAVLAARK